MRWRRWCALSVAAGRPRPAWGSLRGCRRRLARRRRLRWGQRGQPASLVRPAMHPGCSTQGRPTSPSRQNAQRHHPEVACSREAPGEARTRGRRRGGAGVREPLRCAWVPLLEHPTHGPKLTKARQGQQRSPHEPQSHRAPPAFAALPSMRLPIVCEAHGRRDGRGVWGSGAVAAELGESRALDRLAGKARVSQFACATARSQARTRSCALRGRGSRSATTTCSALRVACGPSSGHSIRTNSACRQKRRRAVGRAQGLPGGQPVRTVAAAVRAAFAGRSSACVHQAALVNTLG